MLTYKSRRWEISSVGFDENLQLVGSDAANSSAWLGLPVPAAPTPSAQLRHTFCLATARFGIGERATLRGLRLLVEIGADLPSGDVVFPLRRLVETPTWRFTDGNVMFALKRIRPQNAGYYNSLNSDGLQWRNSLNSAQVFEEIIAGYASPPFNGLIPGDALEPNLAEFFDLRFPWTSDTAASILDCPITGPCTIALFASVFQTNPSSRAVIPGTPGTFSTNSGITPEDAFVGNYPTARYTRVAGSLIFQQTDGGPAIKPGAEKFPPRPNAPRSALLEDYDGRQ